MNTTIKASKIILLLLLPSFAHVNTINTSQSDDRAIYEKGGEHLFKARKKSAAR